MNTAKYRSSRSTSDAPLIGLSISYQRENLLARGLGLEHLRELLVRLARPLLRQGTNLAYGGHWKETEDNFTYDLLRLISAEQQDSEFATEPEQRIGRLYNHCPWPDYLEITPRIEAQWINCCRIVRIDQAQADIPEGERSPDKAGPDEPGSDKQARRLLNAALTLSAMRRIAARGTEIAIPDRPRPERVPPVAARVILGGKVQGYRGFLPGIFEEALVTLESGAPLYLLGGFGGAAEVLSQVLLQPAATRPKEFTPDWQRKSTPGLDDLDGAAKQFGVPPGARLTDPALDDLYGRLVAAGANVSTALHTNLDEQETRELLQTRDMARAVELVSKGLRNRFGLEDLPA